MKQRRLQELDRSNFEIVKGEPDIRGWDVKNTTNQKIGSVEELILDAKEKKVRYMIVDLDENELKLKHRKVLIPIGLAELDQKHDDVLMPNVSLDQVCQLPDYDKNSLTVDMERRISSTFGRTVPLSSQELEEKYAPTDKDARKKIDDEVDPDFYRHEHYNLDNLYKNRLHDMEPARKNESEYERGLRLWERRSEGGILEDSNRFSDIADEDINEEGRNKIIRSRRTKYRERRYKEE